MDVLSYPSPPPACLPDAQAAATAECGVVMQPLCEGQAAFQTTSGPILFDPSSNCSTWMQAVQAETFLVGSLSGGQPYLDAAMTTYCGTFPSDPACSCLAFPSIAADWCSQSSCLNHALCPLSEIAQSTGPGSQDLAEIIQFADTCNPYMCWLQACYQPDNLLTSDVYGVQIAPLGCSPWCIEIESRASISANVAPMPPGSFDVEGSGIISKCSDEATDALPFITPVTLNWSANSVMMYPMAISNAGDFPLVMQVTSVTAPWATMYPSENFAVAGRTTRQMMFVADQDVLASLSFASPGGSFSTDSTISFSYPNSIGVAQSYSTILDINVFPPHPPITMDTNKAPAWVFGMLGLVGVLVVLLMAKQALDRRWVIHQNKALSLGLDVA